MPKAITTVASLIKKHAKDLAFVAEEEPATNVHQFAQQLDDAWNRLEGVDINGAEELMYAAKHVMDAHDSIGPDARVCLRKAEAVLEKLPDMVDEYRLVV